MRQRIKVMRVIQHRRRPAPGHYSVENYFRVLEEIGYPGVELDLSISPWFSQGLFKRLGNLAHLDRASDEDIHHIAGDVHYLGLGLPRDRTVLTILDCEMLNRSSGLRHALLRFFWFTLPMRGCAAITTISSVSRLQLESHFGLAREDIDIVPTCVDPLFLGSPKKCMPQTPLILQMGTKANKNIERLAVALQGVPCRLAIVGGLRPGQWQALTQANIQFTEYSMLSQEEVIRLYREADLVTLVSTEEGFGMPIVEAQLAGRPVVTSCISSMPEVAADGARLVDPFDPESIRRGILEVIQSRDLRHALLAAGRLNADRFSPESVASMYSKVFHRVREGRGRVAPS